MAYLSSIELKADAAQEALSYLDKRLETKQRLDKVAKLIEGFESQNGMELLSTVHWVVNQDLDGVATEPEQIILQVHQWNSRKKKMKPAHIIAAWKRLHDQGWLARQAQI